MIHAAGRATIAGVALSPLSFGAMRLDRAGDADASARLISCALDLGVNTFHVSNEYSTWPLFQQAWRKVKPAAGTARLVLKVGAPHFGESSFDPRSFLAKIDDYRCALGTETIDVVQWLLRHDLEKESERLDIFRTQSGAISECVESLKASGAIQSIVSFPYTRGIAELALDSDWCDGLALYCNPLELGMIDLFDAIGARGKAVVAIRPFAAGRLFTETPFDASQAIALSLAHPAVATVVASMSSCRRLKDIAAISRKVQPDPVHWAALVATAREAVDV